MKFPRSSSLVWRRFAASKYFKKLRQAKATPVVPSLPTWQSLVSANPNLFSVENDWSNAAWATDTSAAAIINADIAPDGTNTAAKITDTSTTVVQTRSKSFTVSTANLKYKFSGFFKADTSKIFSLRSTGGANFELVVNLETGEAVFRTASAVAGESFSVVKLDNGWYYVSFVRNSISGSSLTYSIRPAYNPTLSTNAPTNLTVGNILVWRPKLELL